MRAKRYIHICIGQFGYKAFEKLDLNTVLIVFDDE